MIDGPHDAKYLFDAFIAAMAGDSTNGDGLAEGEQGGAA